MSRSAAARRAALSARDRQWRRGSGGAARDRDPWSSAEQEEDCAAETKSRPQVVQPHRLFHVEDRERDEDAQRDHLLDDLELAELERGMADAVRWDLKQILEQRDAPAHERGDDPGPLAEISQVRIPGERHEDVGTDEQKDGLGDDRHASGPGEKVSLL